jgi:hypothetical protein
LRSSTGPALPNPWRAATPPAGASAPTTTTKTEASDAGLAGRRYGIDELDAPATGNRVGWSFTTTGEATLKPRTTYRLAVRAQLIVGGRIVDSPLSATRSR